jgi:hypothetical protein
VTSYAQREVRVLLGGRAFWMDRAHSPWRWGSQPAIVSFLVGATPHPVDKQTDKSVGAGRPLSVGRSVSWAFCQLGVLSAILLTASPQLRGRQPAPRTRRLQQRTCRRRRFFFRRLSKALKAGRSLTDACDLLQRGASPSQPQLQLAQPHVGPQQ